MADHAESSREAFCSDFICCAVKERNEMLPDFKDHNKVKGFSEEPVQKVGFWETTNKAASAV